MSVHPRAVEEHYAGVLADAKAWRALEQRVAELEAENARLRSRLTEVTR